MKIPTLQKFKKELKGSYALSSSWNLFCGITEELGIAVFPAESNKDAHIYVEALLDKAEDGVVEVFKIKDDADDAWLVIANASKGLKKSDLNSLLVLINFIKGDNEDI